MINNRFRNQQRRLWESKSVVPVCSQMTLGVIQPAPGDTRMPWGCLVWGGWLWVNGFVFRGPVVGMGPSRRLTDWLTDRPTDWLTEPDQTRPNWLTDRQTDRLTDSLTKPHQNRPDWQIAWLIDRTRPDWQMSDWLTDWLTDWLMTRTGKTK